MTRTASRLGIESRIPCLLVSSKIIRALGQACGEYNQQISLTSQRERRSHPSILLQGIIEPIVLSGFRC